MGNNAADEASCHEETLFISASVLQQKYFTTVVHGQTMRWWQTPLSMVCSLVLYMKSRKLSNHLKKESCKKLVHKIELAICKCLVVYRLKQYGRVWIICTWILKIYLVIGVVVFRCFFFQLNTRKTIWQ